MSREVEVAAAADPLARAFEHSITWEDDIWRADPVDVELVHLKARRKFADLLQAITTGRGAQTQARILLFHGQSGAGKTHLIRALRTAAHRQGKAYFGYAQMTPDIQSYADYYLRRLVASLEKPYDPDGAPESALARLTSRLVGDPAVVDPADLAELRDASLDAPALARMVLRLADDIVSSPRFADQELDINIVRALLYLQRADPRIDQRIRQYLYGRPLNDLAAEAVAALDPNGGEGRAFEIIESLGNLIWSLDRAALVFTIDQVEDLRFFADAEERFQKAARDLIQIANRLPTAIIIISCLEEFYAGARKVLAQSYVDRIEKSGPVALIDTRTPEEARLIIARRIEHEAEVGAGSGISIPPPSALLTPDVVDELGGLSTRRLLEHAQSRFKSMALENEPAPEPVPAPAAAESAGGGSFISRIAAALSGQKAAVPVPAVLPRAIGEAPAAGGLDYREIWDRFSSGAEAEMPSDDDELIGVLSAALQIARDEWSGTVDLAIERADVADDLPAVDVVARHSGHAFETRVFLCNRPTQGGGLKRQLEKVLAAMDGRACLLLRSADFPAAHRKNQTSMAFRRFREAGGRTMLVALPEWERMMTVREFVAHHRRDPGFSAWCQRARLASGVGPVAQLLRLDLLGVALPRAVTAKVNGSGGHHPDDDPAAEAGIAPASGRRVPKAAGTEAPASLGRPSAGGPPPPPLPSTSGEPVDAEVPAPLPPSAAFSDWTGLFGTAGPAPSALPEGEDAKPEDLPLSVLLDENSSNASSILAGREIKGRLRPVTLNRDVLKRHAAVLGGSGSGKTTLALSLIEQLLLRGVPAILIDRKGDLCSYANPEVWRHIDDEWGERRGDREKLADAIDVAVYTPGRSSGRPISITLLPNGIGELPEHEQQLLANMSAAALGEMLHLKNSAMHQKQSGTLSVALKILGSRYKREVMLADLIHLLEDEDPELTDLTQRMDPSGRVRRDLVAQLDSLRHRNAVLFEGGGEPMRMEAFLGLGPFARTSRTRLSIIYTGFLGDNENILFWVSQFLSEALRFCQRNPNDALQAVVMLDEADLYIPANSKPATAEPLQSLLKRARSAGLGIMLATQSPGDLDYKSRDQITSWFIGRVREDTALRKLKAAFQSESGLDPAAVLPHQTVGEFHLVQEGIVRPMKAQRSLINAEQVPFDRIEQLAYETKGQDEKQLKLFR